MCTTDIIVLAVLILILVGFYIFIGKVEDALYEQKEKKEKDFWK